MTLGDGRSWLPAALLLLQVPGFVSQILNSPISLVGTVGQSVSVVCPYEKIYENNTKYWCKSPCLWKIVETAVPDVEAWNGRVSIRDVSATLSFRVTMRNLREEDAGTYRCGIDTSEFPGYLFDLTYPVVVTVTPGLHTVLLDPTLNTEASDDYYASSLYSGSLLSCIYFWLLVFLEVSLVLSMLTAVL
ncbi:CMRF35-like molecule 6 [Mustela lutreola]|uniref:CMRF35-like molecule 6 n=1 Tax=Mustela putorius furo TaxID=9669 RepID=A0A8U0SFF0_MUSPF|nr:CMRF35-like molecule 6 [Mustela putorius furo]XP_059003438.1 CMRF35-like molecule 6 [Mustela lutreola]